MAKAIGIEYGDRGFKIVEAEGSAKKLRVTRLFVRDIDPGAEGEDSRAVVLQELRKTLREEKIPREAAAVSLAAGDSILREIQVPFRNLEQIRRVIRFEAEGHIQHRSIDEVVVEHRKAGDIGDKSQVLVFGAGRDAIRAKIDECEQCGIDPLMIDLDPLALYAAVTLTDVGERIPRLMVLEIGATHSTVLLLKDGELVSARCIRLGSSSIDHAIRRDLQIPTQEAEKKKLQLLALSHAGGGPLEGAGSALPFSEGDVLLEDPEEEEKPEIEKSPDELETELVTRSRDDFLAKLHRELVRSLSGSPLVRRVDGIALCGGGCRIAGLSEFLTENFAPRVEILDPFATVPVDVSPEEAAELGPRCLVPLGLAAKLLGHDPLRTNFRQEELRFLRRFDQIKVALASCLTLVLILLCFMGAYFWKQLQVAKVPYEIVVQRSFDIYERFREHTVGKVPEGRFERISKIKEKLSFASEDFDKQLGKSKDFAPVKSGIDPLIAVLDDFLATQKKVPGTIIESIDIDHRLIKLTGWVPEAQYLQVLIDRMEESKVTNGQYQAISPGPTRSSPSGVIRFDKFEVLRTGAK